MFVGMYIADEKKYINKFKSCEEIKVGEIIINKIKNQFLENFLKANNGKKINTDEKGIIYFEFNSKENAEKFIKNFSSMLIKNYQELKIIFVLNEKKENIPKLIDKKYYSFIFLGQQISFGREILETENRFPAAAVKKRRYFSEESLIKLQETAID